MVLCKSSTFKFSWAHADCFILHFMAELATLMPQQNYGMLSETRAIRGIYYVYSVHFPIVTTEYDNASHQWQEHPCSHSTKAMSPLAILGSMLSRFMSPHHILEHLTTTFVWLCWCKSRRLGDWISHSTEVQIQTVTYVPFSELQNVMWSVGTTYCIRINAKAFHLAPHKYDTFVPQGS